MQRDIMNDVLKWKNSKNKKPLIIKGARQVGKTYAIREFAKTSYKHLVEINFERDLEFVKLFNKKRNQKEILDYLKISFFVVVF